MSRHCLLINSVIYTFYCICLLCCWVNKLFFSKEDKKNTYLTIKKVCIQLSLHIYIPYFTLHKSLLLLNEWARGICKSIQHSEIATWVSFNISIDSIIYIKPKHVPAPEFSIFFGLIMCWNSWHPTMFIIKKNKNNTKSCTFIFWYLIQLFSMTVTKGFYQYKSIKASQYLYERCEGGLF